MGKDFFHYWFNGFEESLKSIDEQNRNTILKHCGKACSESYTLQVYWDEYKKSNDFMDFLSRLKNRFPEAEFHLPDEKNIIYLTYHYCACDLVKKGYIKSSVFCECSKQSLLHNWNKIFGENNVDIKLVQSILDGKNTCVFESTIKYFDKDLFAKDIKKERI
jgi:hypothetical protein